jgi:hypothetical protein
MIPLRFWGCLFFHRRFFNEPLHVFWSASFFIGGLFDEPMNEGSSSAPLFMALEICMKTLVEFLANLVSCFDSTLT